MLKKQKSNQQQKTKAPTLVESLEGRFHWVVLDGIVRSVGPFRTVSEINEWIDKFKIVAKEKGIQVLSFPAINPEKVGIPEPSDILEVLRVTSAKYKAHCVIGASYEKLDLVIDESGRF